MITEKISKEVIKPEYFDRQNYYLAMKMLKQDIKGRKLKFKPKKYKGKKKILNSYKIL